MSSVRINRIVLFAAVLFLSVCRLPAQAQDQPRNAEIIEVITVIPDIVVDIRYATPLNFMHRTLYDSKRCWLRRGTANRLSHVQQELKKEGLGLKIMDGYRPLSVQKKMWKVKPNPNYVADPKVGSMHNRGAAVDVTLVDAKGNELPMGTGYDDFTKKAHIDNRNFPPDILRNRDLLKKAMLDSGFIAFRTEWWHFADVSWEKYPVEDIDFRELEKGK
ncbi:MAG TPA: M15 family metallopeptidase [bacterium]|nr:M15 family metallopeptidase [bacterium]